MGPPLNAPFTLQFELVARGEPQRWAFVLHGVFGRGANWRLFSRRLAEARDDWGFVLVDLRGHGGSCGAPPPHDLVTTAADLGRLEASVPGPVRGVLGHSLGGKVALQYASTKLGELDQVWVLDSRPGTHEPAPEPGPTERVYQMLCELPPAFDDRKQFIELVQERGYERSLAAWLAMNLKRAGDTHRMQLDVDAIGGILKSYFASDMWSEVERPDPSRELHFVVGGASFVLSEADRQRLAAIDARVAGAFVHTFETAGHWLHVDEPDRLHELIANGL